MFSSNYKQLSILFSLSDAVYAIIVLFCSLTIISPAFSTVINVPADQSSVQAGIDAAVDGDTVLVAPGTYVENILVQDKIILLTSYFMYEHDPSYIFSTILDGSSPSNSDSASVVRLTGYVVDTNMILQGFTITKGTGTVWFDEHGFGTYREGGGILCALGEPTIQYNLIIDNEAINTTGGLTSAGGGGIRSGDADLHILNNMILHNRGLYGAGIVINFGRGRIKNNVIAYNTGGNHYAGSGIWKYGNGGTAIIENNTIAFNESTQGGGGVYIWSTSAILRNNIIWGNKAPAAAQIRNGSASITVINCDVQGGYSGTNNIDSDPFLFGNYLYIPSGSPCIDTGDTAVVYSDIEDSGNSGFALWPSFDGLRNDMGAYGGPDAFSFEPFVAYADSTLGWVPHLVNFVGYTALTVTDWNWTFGDNDSATGQTPSHSYTVGGNFDIGVGIVTGSDTIFAQFPKIITALADTLMPLNIVGNRGDTIEIPIYAHNNTPITKFQIPYQHSGNLDLSYIDYITDGCRTDSFETQTYLAYSPSIKHYFLKLETLSAPLELGTGPVLKIRYVIPENALDDDTAIVSVSTFSEHAPLFSGPLIEYEPITVEAKVTVIPCCIGTRGDVNGDGSVVPNILDLNFLVNYIFRLSGNPGPCVKESDVNSDGSLTPNILDLNFLINYIFRLGSAPGSC